jgi:hypothetical protein
VTCSFAVFTTGAKGGKGVLVTEDWAEAATDIRSKVEAGVVVRVARVDPVDYPRPVEQAPQDVADAWNVVHMSLSAYRGKAQQLMAEQFICLLARLLVLEIL